MEFSEYAPSEVLKDLVHSYWVFEVKDSGLSFPISHETLPENTCSIVIIKQPYFQGVRLLGPFTKKLEQPVFGDSIYIGVRIHPWITFETSVLDKLSIQNQTADSPDAFILLNDLFENNRLSFNQARLEHILQIVFSKLVLKEHDEIKFICTQLMKGDSISFVMEQVPFSIRVIQKRFKSIVGLTMKQFISNHRQRKLWVNRLNGEQFDSASIYRYDYYDQAHFINDFKKTMNRSHTDFEDYMKQITISTLSD